MRRGITPKPSDLVTQSKLDSIYNGFHRVIVHT